LYSFAVQTHLRRGASFCLSRERGFEHEQGTNNRNFNITSRCDYFRGHRYCGNRKDLLDYPKGQTVEQLLGFRDALDEDLYTKEFWEWISDEENVPILPSHGLAGGMPNPVVIGDLIKLWRGGWFQDVAVQYEIRAGFDPDVVVGYGQIELRMFRVEGEWKMAKVLANSRRPSTEVNAKDISPDFELLNNPLPEDAASVVAEFASEHIKGLPTSERNAGIYAASFFEQLINAEKEYGDNVHARYGLVEISDIGNPIILWARGSVFDVAVTVQRLDDEGLAIEGGYVVLEFRLIQNDDGGWEVFRVYAYELRSDRAGTEGEVWQ
jgi:hypothetical protein